MNERIGQIRCADYKSLSLIIVTRVTMEALGGWCGTRRWRKGQGEGEKVGKGGARNSEVGGGKFEGGAYPQATHEGVTRMGFKV